LSLILCCRHAQIWNISGRRNDKISIQMVLAKNRNIQNIWLGIWYEHFPNFLCSDWTVKDYRYFICLEALYCVRIIVSGLYPADYGVKNAGFTLCTRTTVNPPSLGPSPHSPRSLEFVLHTFKADAIYRTNCICNAFRLLYVPSEMIPKEEVKCCTISKKRFDRFLEKDCSTELVSSVPYR